MNEVLKELTPKLDQQPRHIALANEISRELINNFNGKEQYEFLDLVRKQIDNDYEEKLVSIESELKRLHSQRDEFYRNVPTVAKNY